MLTPQISFTEILLPYKEQVEEKIQAYLLSWEAKTHLRDACEYALLNGGKRFRPTLVLMIAKALRPEADVSEAALGIEFFHTASLIADDLPCMDNDDERRNKPTLHKIYGEAIALLATYALIAAGYECLAKNAQILKDSSLFFADQSDRICVLALENATHNTGILGATGGQFLDIDPPNLTLATIRETIYKKTVSLFEISFVWGWLFGGGDLGQLPIVKKCAEHFGIAFQLADDLEDMEQDIANKRLINLANVSGKENARRLFHEEIYRFEKGLEHLQLESKELKALKEMLIYQVESFFA
jgi:geranylgeranyl diphosphate synthase type II